MVCPLLSFPLLSKSNRISKPNSDPRNNFPENQKVLLLSVLYRKGITETSLKENPWSYHQKSPVIPVLWTERRTCWANVGMVSFPSSLSSLIFTALRATALKYIEIPVLFRLPEFPLC